MAEEEGDVLKRKADSQEDVADEEDHIGPKLTEAVQVKRHKRVEYEHLYVSNLPSNESYEKSYMHRDIVSHVVIAKTDFVITGSIDGHVKFWKKQPGGIEFVKHFRTHIGNVQDMSVNSTGSILCTISNDKSLKVFDIVNFDMINMLKLEYNPVSCCWIHSAGDPIAAVAVSDADTPNIYVYDGKGDSTPLHVIEKLHRAPVNLIRYNHSLSVAISFDSHGMLDYWSSPQFDYKFPDDRVDFESKLDTDLFEFAKKKTTLHDVAFTPDGENFATISDDRQVRVFKFRTGKLVRVFDESLKQVLELQQTKKVLPNMEFGKRMAIERELEKSDQWKFERLTFDMSGYFVLYPTLLGVKVVNWVTNKVVKVLGKGENLRPLQVSLYQDIPNKPKATMTAEMKAADNPNLEVAQADPSLFTTAYKKNRFYIFSRRDPEHSGNNAAGERDVFNEKPTREEIMAATDTVISDKTAEAAIIHTSMGDMHVKLFAKECPRTVENFCVHARNGYYNGHIFHRVIKQFMIQTGDPTGTGTGGESVFGGEFEDEFHPSLKHDKPYMLSMANAGKNTNGSQFFVTVVPSPWLDNKHTVFGRLSAGMDVAQNISQVRTHPKTDKPYDEIKIVNISIK